VLARLFHVGAAALLFALFALEPLHPLYLAGVAGVAVALAYEHSLVSAADLSKVNAAFFMVNGWISVGYFVTAFLARRLA
jgi:4-hydroxybenzoate polyprenyltransferase